MKLRILSAISGALAAYDYASHDAWEWIVFWSVICIYWTFLSNLHEDLS